MYELMFVIAGMVVGFFITIGLVRWALSGVGPRF